MPGHTIPRLINIPRAFPGFLGQAGAYSFPVFAAVGLIARPPQDHSRSCQTHYLGRIFAQNTTKLSIHFPHSGQCAVKEKGVLGYFIFLALHKFIPACGTMRAMVESNCREGAVAACKLMADSRTERSSKVPWDPKSPATMKPLGLTTLLFLAKKVLPASEINLGRKK